MFSSAPARPRAPASRRALRAARRCVALALCLVGPLQLQALDAGTLQRQAAQMGGHAPASLTLLLPLMAELKDADEHTRLIRLNTFFNRRIEFREDPEVWGQVEHWASPLESLARGQGDCEDYAIAKYFSLIAAGVPGPKLRLVYVRALQGSAGGPSVAHMVLAYHASPGAEPLILDNLITDVRPASRRPDLVPVFSFNAEGLWQGVGSTPGRLAPAHLSRWHEVLRKAQSEGFL